MNSKPGKRTDWRAAWRWQFLKRNKNFQDAAKEAYGLPALFGPLKILPLFKKEFGLPWTQSDVDDAQKAINGKIDNHVMWKKRGIYESSISVIKNEGFTYDERELSLREQEDLKKEKGKEPRNYSWISNHINLQDNSIILKIKLNKGRESVIREIQYLLDLLEMENACRPSKAKKEILKPRWDVYKKFIEVYDLRHEKNKSWREIAKAIFPKERSVDSGMRKVRYYHEQAKKMIEGGWKQI